MSGISNIIDDSVLVEQVEVGWDVGAGVCGGRAAALVGGAHQGAGGAVPRAAVAGTRRPKLWASPNQTPKISNPVVCQSKLGSTTSPEIPIKVDHRISDKKLLVLMEHSASSRYSNTNFVHGTIIQIWE